MDELRPGLWTWTARHPDWTPEESGPNGWDPVVRSYACVESGTLLLLDPLAPPWEEIDPLVGSHGPPHVLVTLFWHARSSPDVLHRYESARVWVHAPAEEETAKRTRVTDTFVPGDALPGGIAAYDAGAVMETAFWLPEHGAVVVGDALMANAAGPMRPWSDPEAVPKALRPLLDLPVELVLLTHGDPVTEDAREALARAIGG